MEFHPFYLGCLAHASYLVGDGGECAIVDPQRDVEPYLEEAARRGLRIAYVIETHLHADFVSGHCELARRTGAKILIGHAADARFDHVPVRDGDEVTMGDVRLRFLETPGHTPEGITVLVHDGAEAPRLMLTGDTLFIGDVGRHDLVGAKGWTAEAMAGAMYDSLHGKLLTYQDEVEVWPAHGAGSSCGKNLSQERSSTLGAQRAANPMLQPMPREDFVRLATSGLGAPPAYFPHDAEYNRRGAPDLAALPAVPELAPEELRARAAAGAVVLDVRSNVDFGAGHVPGALNVGLGGQFASWCGKLVPVDGEIALVVAAPEQVAEARTRLARVGIEGVVGALAGGMDAWEAAGLPVATSPQIDVRELERRLRAGEVAAVLDVRGPGEYADGHVAGAVNVPLDQLAQRMDEVPDARPLAVFCLGGYRSSAGLSRVAPDGGDEVVNVLGGMRAWREADLPVEVPAPA